MQTEQAVAADQQAAMTAVTTGPFALPPVAPAPPTQAAQVE